ncbi:MAG: type VII toxin-antitoxin system HepT family RNase toxin [Acidimicrobiales bacterium]
MSDDLAVLEAYVTADRAGLRADPARLGHVKYLFVTALEGCIDAAHHVCASQGWGPPETNAAAMSVLASHGALPEDVAVAMADAARFRNVLVHGYATVDDDLVVSHLDHLGDITRFVASLANLADE